jgi:hypothetical protein
MRYLRFGSRNDKKSKSISEHQEDMEQADINKDGVIASEDVTAQIDLNKDGVPAGISDEHLKEATKLVVKNVMEVLQPLLDKLAEAVAQQKQEANAASQPISLEDQLAKLKEASAERLALQEQKIALRMQKLQSRLSVGK